MPDCPWAISFAVSRVVPVRGHNPAVPLELTKAKSKVMELTFVLGKEKLFEVFTQVEGNWNQWLLEFRADDFLTSPVTG
jgi:hypothetical protein